MPLFERSKTKLITVEQRNFDSEKELQNLIEKNMGTVFNCKFVASEFVTGVVHAGRIDTLAFSEDGNPVIIEYKKKESSELINQSLFYLAWIHDHKGDYEIAVKKALGQDTEVDWSDIRVICIAPNYRKYDLHAVQVMGANLELWSYRLYENGTFYLEEVFRKSVSNTHGTSSKLSVGQKAAETRRTGSYTFEEHLAGKSEKIRKLVLMIQEYIVGLDPSIEEAPKKYYIAYKISQNIVCMEVQQKKILLFFKLDASKIDNIHKNVRDVSNIGHLRTGCLEMSVTTEDDMKLAENLCEKAYNKVGG